MANPNPDKAFDVSEGLMVPGGVFITGGTAAPTYSVSTPTIYHQSNGAVWVNAGGAIWTKTDAKAQQMQAEWDANYPTYYTEYTYNPNGSVATVNYYNSAAKTVHLFSKVFTYTGNKLTSVVLTRIIDSATLTLTIAYSGNDVASVTRS